jgi:hypothetical protein
MQVVEIGRILRMHAGHKKTYKILSVNLKGRYHLGHFTVGGRITLKLVFKGKCLSV